MKRRAPGQTTSHFAAHKHPANHCRAVVRVDGAAIRQKIRKDYEKARRNLDSSRQQLDQFQQTDLPAFTRWLSGHFGALMTELRELSQKIAVDEALIFQVESETMFGGGSHARAYKRVMELRENPAPAPPQSDGSGNDPEGGADPFGPPPDFEDSDGAADPLDAFFDEIFGAFGPGGRRPGQNSGP